VPKTILIVEDNDDNRSIYRQYLTHAGYRILEAGNGVDGIALALSERPDLVLMDISMPQMDGLTATRHLKADPVASSIPIIALTAHAMPTDADTALAAGCDAYLAKPVMPRDVRAEIERWIGPAARENRPSPERGIPPGPR
jgi:CheY-like chemotaxis protein